MNLHEKIKSEISKAMKEKLPEKLNALRVISSEFPRLNLPAGVKPTDEQATSILRKLQKNEKTILELTDQKTSIFLEVVESYLPQLMSEQEILSFINSNIDIGSFKNIMQAMGPIMKELKGKADGNDVKKILMKMKGE